jgi:iron complex outermembrane recepter protein
MYVWRVCLVVFSICVSWCTPLLAESATAGSDASGPAVASSDAAPEAEPGALQEIVVTAQKRQQAISDVGLTIVAASAEQLQSQGVTDVASLTKVVPGLTTTVTTNGTTIYSIRGVNYNAYNLSAQPAVAVYLDEAPLAYPALTQGAMLDVQRVEVLKGPQGTLFGANSTGGSVNVIAAKPTATFAAGTEVSVNNWAGVSAQGYVSGPLTDTLRARFSASTDQFGSWQKGYFGNNQTNGKADRAAARLLLDWAPIEGLKVGVNLNANFDRSQPQAFQPASLAIAQLKPGGGAPGVNPALLTYPFPPPDDRAADFDTGFQPSSHDETWQSVLRADYDLNDDMTLTSQSDYVHLNVREMRDIDATSLALVRQGPVGSISSFSQELRLTGKLPSKGLNYIFGANYQHDQIDDGTFLESPYYSALPLNSSLLGGSQVRYRAAGIFANADWEFLPDLTLTTGTRYTSTHESLQGGCLFDGGGGVNAAFFTGTADFLRGLEGLPPGPNIPPGGCMTLDDRPTLPGGLPTWLPFEANLSQDEHNVSWRGGLNYKPTHDALIYALVSRGFKAGGVPTGEFVFASEYQLVKQEQLTSYELGTKLSLVNGAVRPNISAFYYQYKNKQVLGYYHAFIGLLDTFQNLPTAEVEGVDADVTLVPIAGLTIHPAVTYIRSRVGSFNTVNAAGLPVNVLGNRLPFAPNLSATVDAEYAVPLGGYMGFIGGSAQIESDTFADLAESPEAKIPGYPLFDLRVGARSIGGNWHASFWVHNLSNHYYWTNIISAGDVRLKPTGLPRTFGVTVGMTF